MDCRTDSRNDREADSEVAEGKAATKKKEEMDEQPGKQMMDKKRQEELLAIAREGTSNLNFSFCLTECLDEIERLEKDVNLLEKVVRLMNSITIDQKNMLDEMMNQVQQLQMKRLS